ncbi:NnrS family protein [Halomonas shantousis]
MRRHSHRASVLLAYAFRPFFLLTGLYGALVILAWTGMLLGGWSLPLGMSPLYWHSHEMLFGLVPAAIAGFLLTAMTNWTGAAPLKGGGLAALVLLWLAGRVAMWTAGWLPTWLVALVDVAFLPVLAGYVACVLLKYHNRRNLILVAVLGLLALSNGLMHLGMAGRGLAWLRLGEMLAFDLLTVMIVVIAGRITPAFTANWLRMHGGRPETVRRSERFDRYVLITTALMIPADLMTGLPWLGALVALAAAGINAVRLWRWAGWQTASQPLLWILHLAYVWIVLALGLKALAPFAASVPAAAWQHALGIGGIAMLILGVMTRVAMGHTGRPMKLPRFAVIIYLAILAAAVSRVLMALLVIDYRAGLIVAAVGWVTAFALFVALYWPVLSRPRADGQPG